jgi:hypothetical protein
MFSNGKSMLFLNKINEPKEIMKKIDEISQSDISRVMERTFKRGVFNSAFVGDNIDIQLYTDILSRSKVSFKDNYINKI